MPKPKENLFREKFSLLHSQENSEDIKWSSSSSSEYENTSYNDKLCNNSKTLTRKRKRKKKTLNNISNLDIMIIDASRDRKRDCYREKSPILVTKRVEPPLSPILTSSRFPLNKPTLATSPIISMKSFQPKSPILMSKNTSPKYTDTVKKRLAYNSEQKTSRDHNNSGNISMYSVSGNAGRIVSSKLKTQDIDKNQASEVEIFNISIKTEIEAKGDSSEVYSVNDILESKNSFKSDGSGSLLKTKLKLMSNVKNYFESHFSSESTSQNISNTPSPEECLKNETIDILSCRTQSVSSIQNLSKQDSTLTTNTDTSNYFEKNKKAKYKKGGLAFRLNVLLKKQNAHVSLWQHERFLAGNSNFVIPKEEHFVISIEKIDFKYGCYLLHAVDAKNDKYVIFMNGLYVNNNVSPESVIKLYEPFKILEFRDLDYKIIINVCKFECFRLSNR